MYPVLDQAEFRAHHKSLWVTPYEARKSSALVDIILAVTMQYGTALLPPDLTNAVVNAEERGKDAATAGRSFYRRCQALLADELESPSITTLQCYIFSVIYLSNSGCHNTAHGTLALACRVGIILGLHREPLEDLDEAQKVFHRRLWWTLYALEIKAAMELGRPLAISISQVTCGLPANVPQTGSVSISALAIASGIGSCLASNLQFLKLILAARSVYITFYDKCADILGPGHQSSLYGNPQALEKCAEFLLLKMEYLQTWLHDTPDSLKTKRKGGGEQLSTDGSLLDIRPTVSFLQQRQQLFLELQYHTFATNLFRPFICFSLHPHSKTPLAEANAISCVNHAITITNIIHQLLTETELLGGWLESFQWHYNAFLSLAGYVIAYPAGQRTPEARIAIRKAISTFDILSNSLAMAASSAKLARDLAAKADLLIDRFRTGPMIGNPSTVPGEPPLNHDCRSPEPDDLLCTKDPSTSHQLKTNPVQMLNNELLSPELSLPLDSISSMDWIFTDDNYSSDMWTLGQDPDADPFISWLVEDPQVAAER
jgi:hypothetical protein